MYCIYLCADKSLIPFTNRIWLFYLERTFSPFIPLQSHFDPGEHPWQAYRRRRGNHWIQTWKQIWLRSQQFRLVESIQEKKSEMIYTNDNGTLYICKLLLYAFLFHFTFICVWGVGGWVHACCSMCVVVRK